MIFLEAVLVRLAHVELMMIDGTTRGAQGRQQPYAGQVSTQWPLELELDLERRPTCQTAMLMTA